MKKEQKGNIPVFIHHEFGQKSTLGGGIGQKYVRYCIAQAEKYNNKVILFGNKQMKKYAHCFFDVSTLESNKFKKFCKVFVNMSDYKDTWAVGIFKRFFIFEEYMERNNIKEMVMLDSDTLVYKAFTSNDEWCQYDAAYQLKEDQSIPSLPFENNLSWNAVAGVAYFKLEALKEFTNFCIDMYKNHQDILSEKWKVHQQYNLAGGVCEMSLLYLWNKKRNKQGIYNLADISHKYFFALCANIENDIYQNGKYGLKKIRFTNHIPYYLTLDGKKQSTYLLHFGSIQKAYMRDYFYHEKLFMYSFLKHIYIIYFIPCILRIRDKIIHTII